MEKKMNIPQLYKDFGIQTSTESDKHYRPDWINIPCPFCVGHEGHHLGWNISDNYFSCFRCGGHNTVKVLMAVLKLEYHDVKKLLYSYGGKSYIPEKHITVKKKSFKIPMVENIEKLPLHSKYLKSRGFNPVFLKEKYRIKGILYGSVDKMDLRFRIFIPVFFKDKMVSWQTRSIVDSPVKYLSCPSKREIVPHKELLYQMPDSNYIVLCEGVFDVWKVEMAGYSSTCCFGIEYKIQQLKALMKYDVIIIFFDSEVQAQKKAMGLKSRLEFIGKKVVNVCPPIGKDACDLNVKEIKKLIGVYYGKNKMQ